MIAYVVKSKVKEEGGGMLKKVVVLCGEGVGDEKHVRIRKREKKVIEIHLELGGREVSFRVLKSVQILPFRYCCA